jgi:glycosyltransferase involved in cell wall biosynthesis
LHLNGTIGFFRKLRLVKSKFHIGRESTFVFDRFKGLKLTFFKTFYFFGYSKIDLLITQSDMMKERLISSLNSFSVPKKVLTIPNLFNLKDVEKKSLEFVPKFSNYIVSAGRLIPEKGFDVLIDSFVSLNSNKKLIILGEGYERKKLQNLIESHNQSDNIILHGFVDNPMPYFKNADLCVVSSRIEGFPNVLLQMMALNNNVVSTLCAPGVEKLKGVNTCKVSDVGDLSISMSDVLDAQTDNSTVFKTELEKRNVPSFWKTIKRAL